MTAISNPLQVNTELMTLAAVAEKNIGFVIPSYQRPYVWSNDDVIKLFDDIKQAFESEEPQYFIGSVLSAFRNENGIQAYELIDGQQRTTTLMLLSLAFKAVGIQGPLADVSLLGDQPRLSFEIRDSVRNLLGSYAGLVKFTKPGPEAIQSDEYLTHVDANLTVLIQQVKRLMEAKTDPAAKIDPAKFAEYIYNKVVWVNNIVPETMDLNRLFSNMNTAGIQLEPVDLLKAKLFKKISTHKPLYSTIWQACEYMENYFERNLRQLFSGANWKELEYKDLQTYSVELFQPAPEKQISESKGKNLAALLEEYEAGDVPKVDNLSEFNDTKEKLDEELDEETVYCRSIISFELLLIHTLRIFCVQKGWGDLDPRIKAGNLMEGFSCLLDKDETEIKEFIELLWQVRYQFDTWIVKWVEHDDRDDPQLRLTTISRTQSKNTYYINRTAKELSELVQLQAVRNFTGDRSAQYWLTALLGQLVNNPEWREGDVLCVLERLDNQLSLTTETQKEASFKIAQGIPPSLDDWRNQERYFVTPRGTDFEHYWFQKLEYLLWKSGDKNNEKLKRFRITSKNSVEHVYPRNEEYKNELATESLDAFGNLVLLSPGENSSYSNQTVLKKKADFESKPRYDSLKLKAIFELHTKANKWGEVEIFEHQQQMVEVLRHHYQ